MFYEYEMFLNESKMYFVESVNKLKSILFVFKIILFNCWFLVRFFNY